MNTFFQTLFIGFGGFLGAISRFLLSKFVSNIVDSFPFGTLLVNVLGSFVLGFILYSISFGKEMSEEIRNFTTIGFIGAFTTMSTFAYETVRLLELKKYLTFSLNLFLNVTLCLLAIMVGRQLALLLTK